MNNLYLALVHHPVKNRNQEIIGSALTPIDLHDISRAVMTFGAGGFFVSTPFEDQQKMALQIMAHWTTGVGGKINPDRKAALEKIRIASSFENVLEQVAALTRLPVTRIATSAARHDTRCLSAAGLKARLKEDAAHVIALGTAWGLADELIDTCDFILEPIAGAQAYNHLSVRSAASIYLDRICNS